MGAIIAHDRCMEVIRTLDFVHYDETYRLTSFCTAIRSGWISLSLLLGYQLFLCTWQLKSHERLFHFSRLAPAGHQWLEIFIA